MIGRSVLAYIVRTGLHGKGREVLSIAQESGTWGRRQTCQFIGKSTKEEVCELSPVQSVSQPSVLQLDVIAHHQVERYRI